MSSPTRLLMPSGDPSETALRNASCKSATGRLSPVGIGASAGLMCSFSTAFFNVSAYLAEADGVTLARTAGSGSLRDGSGADGRLCGFKILSTNSSLTGETWRSRRRFISNRRVDVVAIVARCSGEWARDPDRACAEYVFRRTDPDHFPCGAVGEATTMHGNVGVDEEAQSLGDVEGCLVGV